MLQEIFLLSYLIEALETRNLNLLQLIVLKRIEYHISNDFIIYEYVK